MIGSAGAGTSCHDDRCGAIWEPERLSERFELRIQQIPWEQESKKLATEDMACYGISYGKRQKLGSSWDSNSR